MKNTIHRKTEFQLTLVEDGKTIIDILELLFPDITIDWSTERGNLKVTAHPHYTWVEVRYKDFIKFAIDNHACKINGQTVFGSINPARYNQANFYFDVIIFGNNDVPEIRRERVNKLLRNAGYTKPTYKEWWNEWHTDCE